MVRWVTALALLVVVTGCGEGAGIADDATVSVYVSAPLCVEAKSELTQPDNHAGDLKLRAICVDDAGGAGASRLAAIGAAARQATEDSTAIAYIGTQDPTAIRFSEPILEEADIPRIAASSGAVGMAELLGAVRNADTSGSLRQSVRDELQ